MVDQGIIAATRRARRYLLAATKEQGDRRSISDLAGLCSIASFFTCAIVNDFSLLRYGRFYHRETKERGPMSRFCAIQYPCRGHEHYWTENNGWIVDGTASQFGGHRYPFQPRFPAIFVSREEELRYVPTANHDFCREAKNIASRLLRNQNFYDFPTPESRKNAHGFYMKMIGRAA